MEYSTEDMKAVEWSAARNKLELLQRRRDKVEQDIIKEQSLLLHKLGSIPSGTLVDVERTDGKLVRAYVGGAYVDFDGNVHYTFKQVNREGNMSRLNQYIGSYRAVHTVSSSLELTLCDALTEFVQLRVKTNRIINSAVISEFAKNFIQRYGK